MYWREKFYSFLAVLYKTNTDSVQELIWVDFIFGVIFILWVVYIFGDIFIFGVVLVFGVVFILGCLHFWVQLHLLGCIHCRGCLYFWDNINFWGILHFCGHWVSGIFTISSLIVFRISVIVFSWLFSFWAHKRTNKANMLKQNAN